MKTLQIYEPAMCCDTGLCGVGVDAELLRISTVLSTLKKKDIIVERYNLNSAPDAFIKNTTVNLYVTEKGVEGFPLTVLENRIVMEGKYPSNQEILQFLELPMDTLDTMTPGLSSLHACCSNEQGTQTSSCGCEGDKTCCSDASHNQGKCC